MGYEKKARDSEFRSRKTVLKMKEKFRKFSKISKEG